MATVERADLIVLVQVTEVTRTSSFLMRIDNVHVLCDQI